MPNHSSVWADSNFPGDSTAKYHQRLEVSWRTRGPGPTIRSWICGVYRLAPGSCSWTSTLLPEQNRLVPFTLGSITGTGSVLIVSSSLFTGHCWKRRAVVVLLSYWPLWNYCVTAKKRKRKKDSFSWSAFQDVGAKTRIYQFSDGVTYGVYLTVETAKAKLISAGWTDQPLLVLYVTIERTEAGFWVWSRRSSPLPSPASFLVSV